jgi:hypothetical protein
MPANGRQRDQLFVLLDSSHSGLIFRVRIVASLRVDRKNNGCDPPRCAAGVLRLDCESGLIASE